MQRLCVSVAYKLMYVCFIIVGEKSVRFADDDLVDEPGSSKHLSGKSKSNQHTADQVAVGEDDFILWATTYTTNAIAVAYMFLVCIDCKDLSFWII